MHRIHPPESVSVLVIVECSGRLHPLMPFANKSLQAFQGKQEIKQAKALPHTLRHPALTLINQARVIVLSTWKAKAGKASPRVTISPVP